MCDPVSLPRGPVCWRRLSHPDASMMLVRRSLAYRSVRVVGCGMLPAVFGCQGTSSACPKTAGPEPPGCVVAPVAERLPSVRGSVKRQQKKNIDVVLASLLTSSSLASKRVQAGGQSDERANERKEDPRGSGWKRPHIRGSLVKVAHARECTRMRPHERASAHTGQRVPSVCSACCPQRVQRVGWRVGGGAETPQRGDSAAASPFDTPLKYAISTFRPLKRPRNDPVPLPYREVPPSVGIAQRAGKRPSWTVSSSGSRIGAKETSRIRTPRVSR
jgi:hypothetical protein